MEKLIVQLICMHTYAHTQVYMYKKINFNLREFINDEWRCWCEFICKDIHTCMSIYICICRYTCVYISYAKNFASLLCEVWLSNWRLWLLFRFFYIYLYCFFFLNFFSIEKPLSFNCDCHNFYVIQPGWGFLWGFDILHVISIYKNTYIQKHIEIDC